MGSRNVPEGQPGGVSWNPNGLLEGTVMDTTLSEDSRGLPAGLQEEAGLENTVTEALENAGFLRCKCQSSSH